VRVPRLLDQLQADALGHFPRSLSLALPRSHALAIDLRLRHLTFAIDHWFTPPLTRAYYPQ
jgi:hypothetical protein